MRTRRCFLGAAVALLMATPVRAADAPEPVVVFAAASLTDAVTEVAAAFTAETRIPIKTSFAASSALARQIESGARAGVFFSADEEWMDYLQRKELIASGTRRDVLGNRLVLVAPMDSRVTIKIEPGAAFASALGQSHIATGDPDSVPAGKYAKAALTKLAVWDQVQRHLVRAENVRSALAFVARGEAPFGIVYLTDARIEKRVKIVGTFPEDTHAPIRYPLAATSAAGRAGRQFVEFAAGPKAAAIFTKYGFTSLR